MNHYREPADAIDLALRAVNDRIEECVFTRVRFFGPDGEHDATRDEAMLLSQLDRYCLDWCADCYGAGGRSSILHLNGVVCPLKRLARFELRTVPVRDDDGDVQFEHQYHWKEWLE